MISSIILTPLLWIAAFLCLPSVGFRIESALSFETRYPAHAAICTCSGLWAGMIIGYVTEYMTSHTYHPVREVANSCETGAATNIIYGLALGYYSNIIPVFTLAICLYISFKLLGLYGIALAAIGMLSNLPTSLAIDSYGPISDNAGGMAEMA